MRAKLLYGIDVIEGLKKLEDESIDCVVTSPPYWSMRDYGVDGQLGLEKSPTEYVGGIVSVFREVKRVLKKTGTAWVVLGDCYNSKLPSNGLSNRRDRKPLFKNKRMNMRGVRFGGGNSTCFELKPKDLIGIPWRVAFALQADGWWLRQDIVWAKANPMPESVKDRCTKSHEYIFLLSKSEKYYFDSKAIQERTVTHEFRPDGVVRDREFHYNSKQNKMKEMGVPANWHQGGRYKKRESKKRGEFQGKTQALPGREALRAIREFKNKRSVWFLRNKPYKGAHFACFPPEIPTTCILAGCPEFGTVLDPFSGSGTTGQSAISLNRNYIGIDLNKEYEILARQRIGLFCETKRN